MGYSIFMTSVISSFTAFNEGELDCATVKGFQKKQMDVIASSLITSNYRQIWQPN